MESGGGHRGSDETARVELDLVFDLANRTWEDVESGADAETVAGDYDRAQAACARLIDGPRVPRTAAIQDRVATALEELEGRARELFSDTGLEPDAVADRLAVLRAQGRLMRRITRTLEGRPPRDETPFLLRDLQDIENGLSRGVDDEMEDVAEPDSRTQDITSDVDDRVDGFRVRVVRTQAERQLEAAGLIESLWVESCVQHFRFVRALEGTRQDLIRRLLDLETLGGDSIRGLVDQLRSEQERLEGMFWKFAESASTADELQVITDSAQWLTGELDEARVAAFDRATPHGIDRLQALEKDGERFHGVQRAVLRRFRDRHREDPSAPSVPTAARRARRRMSRMTRRVRNLVSSQILALRLERIFGHRAVRRWDAMIFWLIVVVMLLLVVDHFSDEDAPGVIGWTVWLDTAICAVLLTDFFVRFALSPSRLRYLRLNFLTEFLPSLPFGLLSQLPHQFRWARAVRVFRVLRVMRPLIRVLRLFLFVARAADRLVDRNAWLLNQNIVFFTDPVKDETVPTLLKRARNLDGWIARTTSQIFAGLPVEAQVRSARWRTRLVEIEVEHGDGGVAAARAHRAELVGPIRDLDVDDVIRTMRELDDNQVAEFMGIAFAEQVTATLRLFRIPFLRRLPVVRFILGPSGAPDPLWTTARLGRFAGDFLAWAQRTINWFADLYGTITGAQFLDRVGMQLVMATSRPAKRLVIFGVVLGFLYLFVQLTRISWLITKVSLLFKILLAPVALLGVICFIPLALGLWFRKIAGQAADFYDRVAEAQFLALTETMKEEQKDHYQDVLVKRVLLPEALLAEDDIETIDEERVAGTISHRIFANAGPKGSMVDLDSFSIDWQKCELMMLFYRDFLDGAFFHRNDTKVANMLLGNLTLENIRKNRLRFDKKRVRRMERIDIGRQKGGLTGPYVWFNFITHSVSQHTARLIIDYNQHCIPLDEISSAAPEDRAIYEGWLERRRLQSVARRRGESLPESEAPDGHEGTLLYRTTEFNALHFLTDDARREEAVRRRYGDDVANLVHEDRRHLIREIFGTYPMHELPKGRRTFNTYEYYRRYLSRGKVFLFPVIGAWVALKILRLLLRRLVDIVRDVLAPADRRLQAAVGRADFDVARRKIHRMRRPVVMEAVRLRAAFDVQYLGLGLPGREVTVKPGRQLVDDLRRLNASEHEWAEFRELRSDRERSVRLLARILRLGSMAGDRRMANEIAARNPALEHRIGECLRAVTTAFVCDHEHVYSLTAAYDDLRNILRRLPRERAVRRRRFRLPAPQRRKVLELIDRCWPVLVDERVKGETDEILVVDGAVKQNFIDAIFTGGRELRKDLETLDEHLPEGVDPYTHAYERLLEVGDQPAIWTEQVIAVRTVATLGLLDIESYENLVARLGEFEDVGVAMDDVEEDLRRL